MKNLVNKALSELMNDSNLNANPLVKLLTESINKSVLNNDSYDSIYAQFKRGLIGINEHLNNDKLNNILSQFDKSENTVDSELLKLSKVANLESKLVSIKESNAYSNPIIKQKVDGMSATIKNGTPEFLLYPAFLREFSQHVHERVVKTCMDEVQASINENAADLEVLFTINTISNMKSPLYEGAINDLKSMLAGGTYTADIIKLKLGGSGLPIIENLVSSLKIVESRNSDNFTLGNGNVDTKICNMIAPATRSKDGSLIMYADNRFLRISESKKKIKPEINVHIEADNFRVSTLDPNYVLENYHEFYKLSESYANLGFDRSNSNNGVETSAIRNFKMGFYLNESKEFDIYLNDSKIDELSSINLTEALVMESSVIKEKVEMVFENLDSLCNFEFIKNVSNDRTLAEATIFNLGGSYFICEKPNSSERIWNKVDEHEMYEYFIKNFQYDISPIFKSKIEESIAAKNKIEAKKAEILENISKLEESVNKINAALEEGSIDKSNVARLEKIKESIDANIGILKEEFVNLDLTKKSIFEQKGNPEDESEDVESKTDETPEENEDDKKKQ